MFWASFVITLGAMVAFPYDYIIDKMCKVMKLFLFDAGFSKDSTVLNRGIPTPLIWFHFSRFFVDYPNNTKQACKQEQVGIYCVHKHTFSLIGILIHTAVVRSLPKIPSSKLS